MKEKSSNINTRQQIRQILKQHKIAKDKQEDYENNV
jgi:hypothetical protein